MPRFALIVDWSGRWDIAARLADAERALTAGGTREIPSRLMHPGLGLLVLSHHETAAWSAGEESVVFRADPGEPSAGSGFLDACAAALRDPAPAALPDREAVPDMVRVAARWDARTQELVLLSEPNGHRPLFFWHSDDGAVVATEPKAVWAALGHRSSIDPDALVQFLTMGCCLAPRTLLRDVRCAEPGTAYRFVSGGITSRSWEPPHLSEEHTGDAERMARAANGALLEVMAAARRSAPRVSVALSGGMDSRYLLAGAQGVWDEVESFTFGEPGSDDVLLAAEVARRAGVVHRSCVPAPDFLERWAAYAVWRTDGLLSCTHAQGMDAVIGLGPRVRFMLNGIGGCPVMGSLLRPSHVFGAATPERAVRSVLATARRHDRPLAAILKPAILAQATTPVEDTLRSIFERYSSRRLGNALIHYWLRHFTPRGSRLGLMLEEPWIEYIDPLVHPAFFAAMADVPLELRYLGRVHRRALRMLAPALTWPRWESSGMPPRWPWPAHALGRYGRRFGLIRRSPPVVDHARNLRGAQAPWLRAVLLDARTLADGYLLPAYLEEIVEAHLSGREDRTEELSTALTIELWRRLFIEREELQQPPVGAAA
jgi:asparagine synthase (glutamine-hydrolysing)